MLLYHASSVMDFSMATDVDAIIHTESLLSASDDEHQLTGSNALDISQIIDDNSDSDCKHIWTLEGRQYDIKDEDFWNLFQSQSKVAHASDIFFIRFT